VGEPSLRRLEVQLENARTLKFAAALSRRSQSGFEES
jgi:hypothetical protein